MPRLGAALLVLVAAVSCTRDEPPATTDLVMEPVADLVALLDGESPYPTAPVCAVGDETRPAIGCLFPTRLGVETGLVPPVANFKEVDPELGALNLSRGGSYPVRYALRLAAGFGSQISMSLLRWVEPPDGERRSPEDLGYSHRIADRPAFDAWLGEAVRQEPDERDRRLQLWSQAPAARQAHPREEHLLPLMVVAGAAGIDRGQTAFQGTMLRNRLSGYHFG